MTASARFSNWLRVVDETTFGDDPLRALRAAQFAARFELTAEERTARPGDLACLATFRSAMRSGVRALEALG